MSKSLYKTDKFLLELEKNVIELKLFSISNQKSSIHEIPDQIINSLENLVRGVTREINLYKSR